MSSFGILKKILQSLRGKKFTGRIDIQKANGQQWHVYLCLSRLIWIDGGYHPYREWHRLLSKYCSNVDTQLINLQQAKKYECWSYYLIISLLERFLITKKQASQLINAKLIENLIDIYQAEKVEKLNYNYVKIKDSFPPESGLKKTIGLFSIESLYNQVDNEWSKWEKLNLTAWNPHYAPIIKNPVLLQKSFESMPETYHKLVSLFNGKFPLIQLADKLHQSPLKLMLWLKPYREKGVVDLVEIPDLDISSYLTKINRNDVEVDKSTNQQLIACIDDSIQICEIMEHIVTEAGYQFMSIRDPLKALPQLIKRKPDVIFLDLVMPIVNGYEICSQIRRISALNETPIIILTSNDSMIDRLRSKMVGANGFLPKPIDQEKLLSKIKTVLSGSKYTTFLSKYDGDSKMTQIQP